MITNRDTKILEAILFASGSPILEDDLKDKMLKMTFSTENIFSSNNTNHFDALTALISLGFDKKSAEKAIDKVSTGEESVEKLIKEALKIL